MIAKDPEIRYHQLCSELLSRFEHSMYDYTSLQRGSGINRHNLHRVLHARCGCQLTTFLRIAQEFNLTLVLVPNWVGEHANDTLRQP